MLDRIHEHYSGRLGALFTDCYMFLTIVFVMYGMRGYYYSNPVTFGRALVPMTLMFSLVYIAIMFVYTIYTRFRQFSGIRVYEVLIILYLIWSTVVTFTGEYPPEDFTDLVGVYTSSGLLSKYCEGLAVLLIGRYCVFTEKHVQATACLLLVQAVVVIAQLFGLDPFNYFGDSNFYGEGIVTNMARSFAGTLGNIGLLSNITGMFAMIFLVVGIRCKTRYKYLYLCTGSLWVVLNVILGSEAPMVGTLGCIILLLPFMFEFNKKSMIIYYGLLSVVAIVGIVVVYFVDLPVTTLHQIHSTMHGVTDDHFGTGRFKIWSDTLEAMHGEYILGHGPDSAGYAGIGYFSRFDSSSGVRYVQQSVDPHSRYLKLLYEGGVPLLLLWVSFVTVILYNGVKYRKQTRYSLPFVAGCLTWSISYLFSVSYLHTDFYLYFAFGCLGSELINIPHGGTHYE